MMNLPQFPLSECIPEWKYPPQWNMKVIRINVRSQNHSDNDDDKRTSAVEDVGRWKKGTKI